MRRLAAIAACACALAFAAEAPQKIIAAKSTIRFVTKQMNVPVEGQFRTFDGTVTFDPIAPAATKAEFTVETGSIDLHNEEGETEARRKLWLDVPGFPVARFSSKSVRNLGGNRFEAIHLRVVRGEKNVRRRPLLYLPGKRAGGAEVEDDAVARPLLVALSNCLYTIGQARRGENSHLRRASLWADDGDANQ